MLVVSSQYQHPVLTQPISFQGEDGTITLQDLNVRIHYNPWTGSKNAPSIHRLFWMALVNRPSNYQLCDWSIAMTPLFWTGLQLLRICGKLLPLLHTVGPCHCMEISQSTTHVFWMGRISAAFARETNSMDMSAALSPIFQFLYPSPLSFSDLECMGFEV